jgi:hypothetical protein
VVAGDESDPVTLSIPSSATISTVSGSGDAMTVTILRSTLRANTSNAQGGGSVLDASAGSATTNLSADAAGDGVNSDGLGQLYVWIGGSVTPTAAQQRGVYNGSFTLSASYGN